MKKVLPYAEAKELTLDIVEVQEALALIESDYVLIGVEDGKILVKSSPTSQQVHVDSIMGDELEKDDDEDDDDDEELRYTFSPWYVPDVLDAHSEWTDKREVQQAFWNYLSQDNRDIRLQHNMDIVAGEWVEGATWPFEVTVPVKHPDGDTQYTFPAGTPFLGIIWEPWAWELIKSGDIRGLSIGGTAKRLETELELDEDYDPTGKVRFSKVIREEDGKFHLYSQDGQRHLGEFDTRAAAERREAQINRIKHMVAKTLAETPFIQVQDLDKHLSGRHDQTSHARGSGKYPRVKDVPASPDRSPAAVAAAIQLRGSANKRSDEITDTMTGIASEFGGEMKGLEYRVKSTDSLARKIDADANAEYGGDVNKAAANISDASRYSMVLDESNYTAGLAAMEQKLAADGYEVRTKNFWQEGDPYQGVNMKLTKDGVTSELQLHTKESYNIKTTQLHPVYENFRITSDPAVKASLYSQMVSIAATIPKPADYETLITLGTPAFQSFTG